MITRRRSTTIRLFALLTSIIAAGALAAGCGSGDDASTDTGSADTAAETTTDEATPTTEDAAATDTAGSDAAGAATVKVGVDGLKFVPEKLDVKAGSTTFVLDNPDKVPHNFVIEQDGKIIGETKLITESTDEVTVDLEPGVYEYYCTPHRAAGMVGTLTVT